MRQRRWSISRKFIALLLTPIASLSALWIFATQVTYGSAKSLLAIQTNYDEIATPGDALISQLERERRLSMIFLGQGHPGSASLTWQRTDTDAAITTFRQHAKGQRVRSIASSTTMARVDSTLKALDQLTTIRQTVDQYQLDRTVTFQMYTDIIDTSYHIYLSLPSVTERNLGHDAQAVIALGRARELLSQ